MKRIFRSILNIKKNGKPTIPLDELVKNYKIFQASKVQPEDPSFILLYHWIEAHYRLHKELPAIELVFERAQKEGNEALLANLKDIVPQIPYIRGDYKAILSEKFEEQNKETLQQFLTKTWQIVSTGVKIGKKDLKGINDALGYLGAETRQFRIKAAGTKTDAQIINKDEAKEVKEEYQKRKRNPMGNVGMFSFLDHVDESFRGIKPGDLFLIAAFVAQGKTIMSYNMAYNGIMQGLNGLYVPLEMNFGEMRDVFYCMHTSNPEWYEHPKYKNLAGKVSYEKFRYGELSDTEQEFFDVAADDFSKREDFGELKIFQPTDMLTPSALENEAYDFNAELKEKGKALDFLVVDYVGLMVPDKGSNYKDFNIDLNVIIKKLKNLALTFDSGRMLRVISPFQVNRDGYKDAIKNDGVYKLTALSNANEAERSSDGVIAQYMDEDNKKNGILKFTCLKHRRGAYFAPFSAHIDFTSMRIRNIIQDKKDSDLTINEIPLDLV